MAEVEEGCAEVGIGRLEQLSKLENQTCLPALPGLGPGWCCGAHVQKRALQAKCARGWAQLAGLQKKLFMLCLVSFPGFHILCRNKREFSPSVPKKPLLKV